VEFKIKDFIIRLSLFFFSISFFNLSNGIVNYSADTEVVVLEILDEYFYNKTNNYKLEFNNYSLFLFNYTKIIDIGKEISYSVLNDSNNFIKYNFSNNTYYSNLMIFKDYFANTFIVQFVEVENIGRLYFKIKRKKKGLFSSKTETIDKKLDLKGHILITYSCFNYPLNHAPRPIYHYCKIISSTYILPYIYAIHRGYKKCGSLSKDVKSASLLNSFFGNFSNTINSSAALYFSTLDFYIKVRDKLITLSNANFGFSNFNLGLQNDVNNPMSIDPNFFNVDLNVGYLEDFYNKWDFNLGGNIITGILANTIGRLVAVTFKAIEGLFEGLFTGDFFDLDFALASLFGLGKVRCKFTYSENKYFYTNVFTDLSNCPNEKCKRKTIINKNTYHDGFVIQGNTKILLDGNKINQYKRRLNSLLNEIINSLGNNGDFLIRYGNYSIVINYINNSFRQNVLDFLSKLKNEINEANTLAELLFLSEGFFNYLNFISNMQNNLQYSIYKRTSLILLKRCRGHPCYSICKDPYYFLNGVFYKVQRECAKRDNNNNCLLYYHKLVPENSLTYQGSFNAVCSKFQIVEIFYNVTIYKAMNNNGNTIYFRYVGPKILTIKVEDPIGSSLKSEFKKRLPFKIPKINYFFITNKVDKIRLKDLLTNISLYYGHVEKKLGIPCDKGVGFECEEDKLLFKYEENFPGRTHQLPSLLIIEEPKKVEVVVRE